MSHGDYYAIEFFTATGLRATGGAACIYHYRPPREAVQKLGSM